MTNPIIKIVELDGTEIERPMSKEEMAQLDSLRKEWDSAFKAEQNAAALKQSVLDKLGLSVEEAKALLK